MTYPNPRVVPNSGVPEVEQEPPRPTPAADLIHALGDGGRTPCGLNPFVEKLAATPFPGLVSCEACQLTMSPGFAASVAAPEERTEEQPGLCATPWAHDGCDCENAEEQSGGAAALRADVVTSEDAETLRRTLAASDLLVGQLGVAGDEMRYRLAAVGREVEALRPEIPEYVSALHNGEMGPTLESIRARLDRIEALVRGEQQ